MILQAFATVGALLLIDLVHGRQFPRVNIKCECGHSNEGVESRIVGGTYATPHVFPWAAAIFYKGNLHCGGALINNRYILTAGHCIHKLKRRDITLGLGMHDIQNKNQGILLPADELILHEEFDSDTVHDFNDIALIKLSHAIPFSINVAPICLPIKGSEYAGHEVKVSGWGRVKNNGDASRYLKQASLRMISTYECKNTKIGTHVDKSMICAYATDTDACQGDSGGPLLYQRDSEKYETIGVVSWGMGCAQRGYPGVYVKLTDYLDWIYSHTADATYCMDK